MASDDGGAAFPGNHECPNSGPYSELGMSLRQSYVGQALAGLSSWGGLTDMSPQRARRYAEAAFEIADACIAFEKETTDERANTD